MAAATLVLGVLQIVTTSSTPDQVRLINLPTGTRWVRIKPRTSQCKVVLNYGSTDDAAIGATAYQDAYADQPWAQFVGGHGSIIGLASASASVACEVLAMVETP